MLLSKNIWLFRVFSGSRSQVQAAAVKVNRIDEVSLVAESACRVLDPLDLGVQGFAGRIGDAMFDERQDIFETTFQHAAGFHHRFQSAT